MCSICQILFLIFINPQTMKIPIFLQLGSTHNLVALSSFFYAICFFRNNGLTLFYSFYVFSKSIVRKAILMFFCRLIIGFNQSNPL